MRYQKCQGIITGRLATRDSDLVITLVTKELGKLVCYARGVRQINSSRAAKLNLFSLVNCELVEKSGRYLLTHTELSHSYRQSKQHLKDIGRLFEIGELVNALLPENEPNPRVFELLKKALYNLHRFRAPAYLERFKLRLLIDLGYGAKTSPFDIDSYIESIIEHKLRAKDMLS